ncbi:MAG: hypothetical protein H0W83_08865 [Planctomycetes bacterium]|nr:hypothetical protein [Planctomycetota bacterium]
MKESKTTRRLANANKDLKVMNARDEIAEITRKLNDMSSYAKTPETVSEMVEMEKRLVQLRQELVSSMSRTMKMPK